MWNKNLTNGSKQPIEDISEEIEKLKNLSIESVVFTFTPSLEGVQISHVFSHIDNIYLRNSNATVVDVANYFKNRNIRYTTKFRNIKEEPFSEKLKYYMKYLRLKKKL